jgi:hypothetical protein
MARINSLGLIWDMDRNNAWMSGLTFKKGWKAILAGHYYFSQGY